MDNETPQYAEWIPTAGGYVANGNVVSKSPHYDENKKFQLSVNPAVFGQTTPENSKITKAKPQVANNPLSNNGITTANTEGSGTDANAMATGIGSLDSMANNTATTGGVLTTPATQSTLAKTPKSVYDTLLDKYAQYQANNNYKGMIDTLTEMSMYDGQDYTQQQQYLTQQRNNKIDNIDNDYSQRIATAQMLGDVDKANALKAEQTQWRNSVGWSDAMTEKYQTAQQQLETDYIPTYLDGIRDITSMITQAIPGLINFQYDPYQDTSLQIAQGYAVSKVKEQMNSTGMYYSSMTQNAITKAVAELVPVYQKMAKEEAMQNLQLLQQTANFLLNIEETQFKLWQGQLDAKIAVNQEKRKEIEAAWDRANQLGYVDNEASAILGIPAGTESYATRKAMTDLLNEKDKEERKLMQDMTLARYNADLSLEKAQVQAELDNWKNAQDDYRGYLYNSQLKQQQFGYDQALKNQQFQNDYYLQLLKNAGSTTTTPNSKVTTGTRNILSYLGVPNEGLDDLDDLLNNEHTPTEKIEIIERNITSYPQGATEEDKELIDAKNKLYIDTYLNGGTIKQIDETLYGKLGENASTTSGALESALALAKDEVELLADIGVDKTSANIAEIYNHILDQVEGAAEFDTTKTNLNDDYTKMKESTAKDIIKSIKENKKLGDSADDIAQAVESYWYSIHNADKESIRGNLTQNTIREITDRGSKLLNGVSGAIDKGLGTLERVGINPVDTATGLAGLLVGSSISPGLPVGTAPNGQIGQELGANIGKRIMGNK